MISFAPPQKAASRSSQPRAPTNLRDFSFYLERVLDELFIDRMEGNEDIFSRIMSGHDFRSLAHEHLAREIFRAVRDGASDPGV